MNRNVAQKLNLARLSVAQVIVTAVLAALLLRLVWLQCVQHRMWSELAWRAHFVRLVLPADRGMILDRYGRKLAVTCKVDSVWANPKAIRDPLRTAAILGRLLKLDPRLVHARLTRDRYFIWIKRKVSPAEAEAVVRANLFGVSLRAENRRFCSDGPVAAHVVGFVDIDNKGHGGIEQHFDRVLTGSPGYEVLRRDGLRRTIAWKLPGVQPVHGDSVVLTIDSRIQAICHEEMKAAAEKWGAEWGVAVVMDPRNGDVLALSSYPGYDPNLYSKATPAQMRNRAIGDWYEPGSTFKPFTLAGLLETGAATPETSFFCENGAFSFGSHLVRDVHGYGRLTLKDVVVKSSNIGIIKAAALLGPERLSSWLSAFEFGSKTGIELPGEARGLLRPVGQWSSYSMSSIPMGQEVAVTAIQLARGFCVFANGGYLVKPRLVLGFATNDGSKAIKRFEPRRKRIISQAVADEICRDILADVVNCGTGTSARLATYQVAGKTGTSQIARTQGPGYEPGAFVGTLVGMAPVMDPRLVVLVSLGKPKKAHYGGTVSAPAVARIIEKSLFCMGVPVEPTALARRVVRSAVSND